MIEAVDLTKTFGAKVAVRGVSFRIEAGEAVGFLGPNGAGKTTTFRMLAGTIGPTSGRVLLAGVPLHEQPVRAKKYLGYMPEAPPLYPELTVREYLYYRAELKGISRGKRASECDRVSERTDTRQALDKRIAHLSKGFRQRVALSDALLGAPPILLLDEPTSGLDPNQVLDVRELIVDLARDHAVLLSTHVLSEVEATCSRAIVIHEGRIVGQGKLQELTTTLPTSRAELMLVGERQSIEAAVGLALVSLNQIARSGAAESSESAGTFLAIVTIPEMEALTDLVDRLVSAKIRVLEARSSRGALDDVFARLTGRSGSQEIR